jgi:hypothetical protein
VQVLEVAPHPDIVREMVHEGLQHIGHDVPVFILVPPPEVLVALFLNRLTFTPSSTRFFSIPRPAVSFCRGGLLELVFTEIVAGWL